MDKEISIFEPATKFKTVFKDGLITRRRTTRTKLVMTIYENLGGARNGFVIKNGVILQSLSQMFKGCGFSEKAMGGIISSRFPPGSKKIDRSSIEAALFEAIAGQSPADQKKHWGTLSKVLDKIIARRKARRWKKA
jgi:hypothetical protein